MSNFESRVQEPWTTYGNDLIQEETVFKTPSQKLCYMYFVSYARAKAIFPSMESIAVAICCKKRNAIEVVKQLEEMGFLEVSRKAGKANHYILHGYLEVVQKMHQSDEKESGAKNAPVQKSHQSGAKITPEVVQKMHPKTKTKNKTEKENSISLVADKILAESNSMDLVLKAEFPDAPFEALKEKLFDDAEIGKVVINSEKQYFQLFRYRLKKWREWDEESKLDSANKKKVYRSNKKPIRTELLPDWYYKEIEPEPEIEPKEDLEAKKREIAEMLKMIDD
jgi:hypothetical protein